MATHLAPLTEAISPESPCGIDLEYTQLLASFDALRIFGNPTPLPPEMDWPAIREQALTALEQSRDLRILTHLAAALLRTEGVAGFAGVVAVAERWLAERWELVFPRLEEDALARQNALSCLADPMAIVAPLRRWVVINHRQLGTVTLREIERLTGQPDSAVTEVGIPDSAQVEAALALLPLQELSTLVAMLTAAENSLDNIVANMQQRVGVQAAPDFAPLTKPLKIMRKVLGEKLAARAQTNSTGLVSHTVEQAAPPVGTDSDEIRSREAAIRAIDAAMLFFRRYEPSSPVSMLLERARRLVAKDFLEVLQDIAPDGLPQARIVGGVRDRGSGE
jgi:type VI secretion system protein ImpA